MTSPHEITEDEIHDILVEVGAHSRLADGSVDHQAAAVAFAERVYAMPDELCRIWLVHLLVEELDRASFVEEPDRSSHGLVH